MKFVEPSALSDPDAAARKLVMIASGIEPIQDGRIHVEKINWPLSQGYRWRSIGDGWRSIDPALT